VTDVPDINNRLYRHKSGVLGIADAAEETALGGGDEEDACGRFVVRFAFLGLLPVWAREPVADYPTIPDHFNKRKKFAKIRDPREMGHGEPCGRFPRADYDCLATWSV